MRPSSIVRFDRLYLAAIVVGLIGDFIGMPTTIARMQAAPETATLGPAIGTIAGGMFVVGALISLLLWYLIARRASTVAKWIVAAFTVLAVLSLLLGLSSGVVAADTAGIARVVAIVLQVTAVALLFRADARSWFAATSAKYDA